MIPGKLHPVFLLFIGFQTASAHVKPPANVTLHCRNLQNVVEWSYSHFPPGLSFSVSAGGIARSPLEFSVYPPALQADLSELSDPGDDYYVTVTAVVGQEESDPSPPHGILFSYFMDSQAPQKCFLDFPSVDVTAQQDGKVQVRFMHPWLVYLHNSSRANSQKEISHNAQSSKLLPELKYDVMINNKGPAERLYCDENVCEGTLPVDPDPAEEKHCVTVKGEMQKMLILGKQEYCAIPWKASRKLNGYVYIIVSVTTLALLTIGLVLFMVYRKNTNPFTTLPNAMNFNKEVKPLSLAPHQVLVPETGSTSPTCLLTSEEEKEEKEFTPITDSSSSEPVLRLPLGVSVEDEGVCDVMAEKSDDGSGYTHGKNLDEDETSLNVVPSGYEKRPVLVEIAPDEQAEGYRG